MTLVDEKQASESETKIDPEATNMVQTQSEITEEPKPEEDLKETPKESNDAEKSNSE